MQAVLSTSISIIYKRRMIINASLLALSGVMLLVYIFNMYAFISRTVATQKTKQQASALDTSVLDLDGQYLKLSSGINESTLKAHGYEAGNVSAYISKTASLGKVSLVGHEL